MATHNVNMTKRFNFFISEDEEILLERLADEQNTSKAEILRQLLKREELRHRVSEPFIVGMEIYEFCKEKFDNE